MGIFELRTSKVWGKEVCLHRAHNPSDPGVQPSALLQKGFRRHTLGAGARYLEPRRLPRLFHHVVRSLPNNGTLLVSVVEYRRWAVEPTFIIMPRDARTLLAAFVSEIFLWQQS